MTCQRCAGPIDGAPFRCHRTNLRLCRQCAHDDIWYDLHLSVNRAGNTVVVAPDGHTVYAVKPQGGGLRLAYS